MIDRKASGDVDTAAHGIHWSGKGVQMGGQVKDVRGTREHQRRMFGWWWRYIKAWKWRLGSVWA